MRIHTVPSIDRVTERPRRNRWVLFASCRKVGTKITGIVLEKLGNNKAFRRSALFPSLAAPRIMVDLFSFLSAAVRQEKQSGDAPSSSSFEKKTNISKQHIPIGLCKCPFNGWINAWAQFLVFLPKFIELVSYFPKSFVSFREFVDLYLIDQREGRSVSSADSAKLIRCLLQSSPPLLLNPSEIVDFHEITTRFFRSIFFPISSADLGSSLNDSIVFHPDWILVLEGEDKLVLENEIRKKMEGLPSEILLSVKRRGYGTHCLVKRQMFHSMGRYFYELDLFIECRPDANGVSFITYVLVDGVWAQCDDERVRLISSRTLSVPLCRGVLFHYKRVGI